MKTYLSVFRMRLIAGMQYRAAAWAGVATQFFWGAMYLMIYLAFYKSSGKTQPISYPQLACYIWLQQAFLAAVMLWSQDNELLSMITTGNVAYELCRPCRMYGFWFARLLALRLSSVTLRCIPILLIAFFLPPPFRMSLPPSPAAFLLFAVSMALALLLVVAISMFIYILTFLTMSQSGARLIIGVGAEFFSGAVIPIPLMPGLMQTAVGFLPFRYTSDLPFRIYSGNIPVFGALSGIAVQVIWVALLAVLGEISLSGMLKRIVIQGG